MRIPFVFSLLLATVFVLGCDSKPAKLPTPKTDAAPATKAAEPREETPAQTGY